MRSRRAVGVVLLYCSVCVSVCARAAFAPSASASACWHAPWRRARACGGISGKRRLRRACASPRLALEEAEEEEEEAWYDPESMDAIGAALQLDSFAPQWAATDAATGASIGVAEEDAVEHELPQKLPPLASDELAQLCEESDVPWPLSEYEDDLLRRSLESLDYTGDWADPESARDSIVLTCRSPEVKDNGPGGGLEFTCDFTDFTAERHQLHGHILEKMLTSDWCPKARQPGPQPPAAASSSASNVTVPTAARAARGPPALPIPSPDEQHVYIVVGVPGSGKDTVLKRYLRSLGLPLIDASADLIKEYLAAWGQDELSTEVRDNNAVNGPGKHLLHAQYLHRESILICDALIERGLAAGSCLLIEKTLWNLDSVLRLARGLRRSGVYCHLLGTHIQPRRNWRFLETRMASGQAFGRYITKEQALEGLVRYQENVETILEDPELLGIFDSLHMYDVMQDRWCVSLHNEREERAATPVGKQKQQQQPAAPQGGAEAL